MKHKITLQGKKDVQGACQFQMKYYRRKYKGFPFKLIRIYDKMNVIKI